MKIQINITKEVLEESKMCGFRDCRLPENTVVQNCAIAKADVHYKTKYGHIPVYLN